MTQQKKFPIRLYDNFPINIRPECEDVYLVVDECIIEECLCYGEECMCTESVESSNYELDELYTKGGPFYKITEKDVTPKFSFLGTFTQDDYCKFSKSIIMEKILSNFWDSRANELCFQLIMDAYEYAQKKKFTIKQSLGIIEMFYSMFRHFMISPTISKKDFYKYFRELLLLYCVQDAPDSLRLFTTMEAFGIAHKFSELLDRNFDLLKAILFADAIVFLNIQQ